jgi:hypothetical protein
VLKKDLDLKERLPRLLTRLDVGVSGKIIELATHAGNWLSRADYQSFMKSGLSDIEKIEKATDKVLLKLLNNDEGKLDFVRNAVKKHLAQSVQQKFKTPIVPPYEG